LVAEGVFSPGGRYRAFLSYSHKDEAAATKLHRQLEAWRVPAKLVGQETARGTVPPRLSPVFRDREELSAGEDLSDAVQAALKVSQALIVLCSPGAKASHWVGKEIESFRALHPDRPILAAIIDGEPADAFPDALTRLTAEPIAADLRADKDGFRLGLMKLAAGLTGLGLDAIVQRDAQRRIRRVTAVTVVASGLVLAMAIMTTMALSARNEAARQRAQAEGLVEYMLTDLREKLKGVGRLDVMRGVNERAMAYYGGKQSLAGLPDESLERRARILHAMGEDDDARGDLDKALAKFTEAHRTTAAILTRKPANADAIFAHAQSEYWVGYAARQKGDRATTLRHWQGYVDQAEALARIEPATKRSLMERGYSYGNLCDVNAQGKADLPAAEQFCIKAIEFVTRASKVDSNDKEILSTLANRHGWLANVLLEGGRPKAALSQRNSEHMLLEQLVVADPQNVDLQTRLVQNEFGTSLSLRALGEFERARTVLQKGLVRVDELRVPNADNMSLVELKIRGLILRAASEKAAGNPQWKASLREAETDLDTFAKSTPNSGFVWAMKQDFEKFEQEGKK
jgi:tetratricopeptide (TPR) repeat protein